MLKKTGSTGRKFALQGTKKLAAVIANVAKALVRGVLAAVGGSGLLLILVIFTAIAGGILASPFSILLSGENQEPGTVPVAAVVGGLNAAFSSKLEEIQDTVPHGRVEIYGEQAEWTEVLAVFAVKTSMADGAESVDVVTLDEKRVQKPSKVFWDMNVITYHVVVIERVRILRIYITSMTAEQASESYRFTKQQKKALVELLEYRDLLQALIGRVDITDAGAEEVRQALPTELTPERRKAVETALSLVGKVSYFWGGVRMQHQYCTNIPWSEAQPGDLAFFPDNSHVGIVVGRDADGNILVCHCSSGRNNVVVTECRATGFTAIGRPDVF